MTETSESLVNIPVEVLCLSVAPIIIRNGRLSSIEPGVYDVVLDDEEPALNTGMRVVLAGDPNSTLRINALITDLDGTRLRVKTIREIRPEKRTFPRLYGGIRVRYRAVEKHKEAAMVPEWLAGNDGLLQKGVWHEPDPFMDFSSSGLKFEDEAHCKVDDLLLMAIEVPSSEKVWHVTSRVVRVEPIPQDPAGKPGKGEKNGPGTHQIAINFEGIPDEAAEALASFTLRIQDALLRT